MNCPYPRYRDSGVEWLGDVPEHWDAHRLQFICRFAYGDSLPSEVREDGDFAVFGSNGVVDAHNDVNTRAPVIVIGRKGSHGQVNFSDQAGFAIDTTYYVDERHTSADVRWLYYALICADLRDVSMDSAVPGLSRDHAYAKRLPIPPLDEQRAIAAFLDRETQRIDALVEKKRRLIERLREYRAALITRTVARGLPPEAARAAGLDPSPRLKPSGVEWLGDVPEHWETLPLKRWVSAKITDGPHETPDLLADGIPFMSAESMVGGRLDFNRRRGFISPEQHEIYSRKCRPQRNDIFMCKSGATTGKVAIVDTADEFSVWSPLALIRVNPQRILAPLMFAVLQARYVQQQVKDRWSYGTQPNLAMEAMERLVVVLPPIHEQRAIAEFLDRETERIDVLVRQVESNIERLQEYRTALITVAVTGKIDVRDAVRKPVAAATA